MHKLKDIWYFVKWYTKKNPWSIVVWTVVIIDSILICLYGKPAVALTVVVGASGLILFFLGGFTHFWIILPIKRTYAEYTKEKQETFNKLRD